MQMGVQTWDPFVCTYFPPSHYQDTLFVYHVPYQDLYLRLVLFIKDLNHKKVIAENFQKIREKCRSRRQAVNSLMNQKHTFTRIQMKKIMAEFLTPWIVFIWWKNKGTKQNNDNLLSSTLRQSYPHFRTPWSVWYEFLTIFSEFGLCCILIL